MVFVTPAQVCVAQSSTAVFSASLQPPWASPGKGKLSSPALYTSGGGYSPFAFLCMRLCEPWRERSMVNLTMVYITLHYLLYKVLSGWKLWGGSDLWSLLWALCQLSGFASSESAPPSVRAGAEILSYCSFTSVKKYQNKVKKFPVLYLRDLENLGDMFFQVARQLKKGQGYVST